MEAQCIKVLPYYHIDTHKKRLFYLFCMKIDKRKAHYYVTSDREGNDIVETMTIDVDGVSSDNNTTFGLDKYFTSERLKDLKVIDEEWLSRNVTIYKNAKMYPAVIQDGENDYNWFTSWTKDAKIIDYQKSVCLEGDLFQVKQAMRDDTYYFKPKNRNALIPLSDKLVCVKGMNFRFCLHPRNTNGLKVGLVGVPSM